MTEDVKYSLHNLMLPPKNIPISNTFLAVYFFFSNNFWYNGR